MLLLFLRENIKSDNDCYVFLTKNSINVIIYFTL